MIFSWLAKTAFGSVFGVVTDGIRAWSERKKIRQQASINLESKIATADIDWDNQQVRNSESSWKDEFWTIVLAIPAILAFVPSMASYVREGFEVLSETPEWYRIAIGVAIGAAFGTRKISQMMAKRKPKTP